MVPALPSPWRFAALVALALLPASPAQGPPVALPPPGPAGATPAPPARTELPALPPGWVHVKLTDDSLLPLKLLDDKVEIQIKYGKLAIPVANIRSIDV